MDVSTAAWLALIAALIVLLLLDLFVIHRGEREITMKDAAWSTAGFIAISIAFGVVLAIVEGPGIAGEFFAGYLLEKSLSLDNVFVWALVFSAFAIPAAYQHRVLFYGIFGALVLRGAFVAAGAELLSSFEWVVYVFGALLLWSGVRMLRGSHEIDPRSSRVVRVLRHWLPTTERLRGAHLFVRANDVPEADRPRRRPLWGMWFATPMLAVLAIIEFTDLIFAVDSIPAIFGVTREPFLVFSATALALLGLRSMYFLLAGMRDRFAYLDTGLAAILVFIGAKFLLTGVVHIPVAVSLLVIVGVMTIAIIASLRRAPHGGGRVPRQTQAGTGPLRNRTPNYSEGVPMTRKTRTTTPSAVGLLIRFMLLVLAVIAAAVAAFAVDTVWALVAAIVVLVALLLEVVILISRYLRATGDQELVVDSEVAAVPSEPAVSVAVPETPPAGTRLLVLAGEAAPSIDEVPPSVRTLIAEADNVFVIAPTLPSRAQWLTSDVDRPRAEAKRRLDRVLSQLRGADVAAAGAVGDDTPLTTIGDGLLRFEPDHVVLALRSAEYAGWQERGLMEAIGEEIRVPLTAFAVAGAGRREAQPSGTAPAQ